MYNESLGHVNKVVRVPAYFIGKPYHLWEWLRWLTASVVFVLFKYCHVLTLGLVVCFLWWFHVEIVVRSSAQQGAVEHEEENDDEPRLHHDRHSCRVVFLRIADSKNSED